MKYIILRSGAIGDIILTFPLVQSLYSAGHTAELIIPAIMHPIAAAYGFTDYRDIDTCGIHHLFTPDGDLSPIVPMLERADCILNFLDGANSPSDLALKQSGVKVLSMAPPGPACPVHAAEYLAGILPELSKPEPAVLTKEYLPSPPIQIDKAYCIIHPGTGSPAKRIDNGLWEQYLSQLPKDIKPVLITGPAEEDLETVCREWAGRFNGIHINTVSLLETVVLISNARMYAGLDSGISHLAGLTDTPGLAVFHTTDPDVWRPYGSNIRVVSPMGMLSR